MKNLLTIFAVVALVLAFSGAAIAQPTIDGTMSPGEWDAYLLGTSVTTWEGGMSVDVYGYADDTYLYVAYVADMTQLGWATAAGLCVSANLDYKTPQSASWPEPGYTHISVYGDGFAQTDGSGWNWPDGWGNTDPSVFTSRGIELVIGEPCYGSTPNPNIAEVKIPLNLLTYAGNDGQIRLSGQYWQYDWAEPFYVDIPPPDPAAVLDHFKCYKVKEIPPKFEKLEVLLEDQFETKNTEVKKPKIICIPVSKDGSEIKNAKNFILKLYDIKDVKEQPKFEELDVFVTDQFGEEFLTVKKPKYLAVPALKEEIE